MCTRLTLFLVALLVAVAAVPFIATWPTWRLLFEIYAPVYLGWPAKE